MSLCSLRSLLSATAAALFIIATHGCSYAYTVILDVEIAPDVEIPEGVALIVIQTDEPPEEGRTPDDAPWGVALSESVVLDADQRAHTYEGGTCCSPAETNYSWAYLDLDNDGVYDEGEPYGADPDNPVEVEADYQVTLVVRNPE